MGKVQGIALLDCGEREVGFAIPESAHPHIEWVCFHHEKRLEESPVKLRKAFRYDEDTETMVQIPGEFVFYIEQPLGYTLGICWKAYGVRRR